MEVGEREERLRRSFMEFVLMSLTEQARDMASGRTRESILTSLGTLPLHDYAKTQQIKKIKKYLSAHKNKVDCTDPESGVTPLITACYYGHLNVVKLLLSRGADVNFRCAGLNGYGLKYSNVTPAYVAADEGHEEVLRYLVEKGADVNQKCLPLGYTPLHSAIRRGHEDVVYTLVDDLNATVNISCTDGDDPVLTAVKLKAHEILDTLVSAEGVDCSVPDTNEKVTPLHYAAYLGDLKSVDKLYSIGKANLNAELVGGFTPLDLATQQKHKKVSDFLRNVGAQRSVRSGQWQPFIESVARGLLPLKAAINRGANINARIAKGGSALHYNVTKLNWEACKFLLRKGADVNSQDHFGNTPLHMAANIGRTDYIQLLLDNGADAKALNGAKNTPLHNAAKKGHYSAAKLLISNGADINAVEHEGGSPIFSAVVKGHGNVVKLLLNSGVDPNSKARIDTIDDLPVLILACMHSGHKPDVIRALVNAGADVNGRVKTSQGEISALHVLPVENHHYEESLRILIEAGAFIDAEVKALKTIVIGNTKQQMEVFGTPLDVIESTNNLVAIKMLTSTLELFKAVRKNDLRLAKVSIAQGGLVNCCSAKFETPLIYASWKGYLGMVKFLLEQGASLTMQAVKKSSPLHYAAKYNHKAVVIELLRAGAKFDEVCCNKTPLQLAEEGKHSEIASIFKFFGGWLVSSGSTSLCPTKDSCADPNFKRHLEEANDKVLEKDLCALFGGIGL